MAKSRSLLIFKGLMALAGLAGLFLTARPAGSRRSFSSIRSRKSRIYAKAALFMTSNTRRTLFALNARQVRPVASLSKMMAVLVIVERHLKLQGITRLSRVDRRVGAGGCRSRLRMGARYRNNDLLHAALLASDNNAVSALGRSVGLEPAALVSAMNRRARIMGLKHTRFLDPVGINVGNVSTAYEVAAILRAAVRNPTIRAVMQKPEHYARAVWPRGHNINYLNTNLLLHRRGFKVLGGKTGYNHKAGYCLATALRISPFGNVLAVVLGSQSKLARFRDINAITRLIRAVR